MAALQRFKLLATQCTAAPPPSPSRSPAPPCFRLHRHNRRHHLRKKPKTLRRLISAPDPDPFPIDREEGGGEEEEKKGLLRDKDNSRTLRDLFVSSPKGKGGGDDDGGGSGGAVGRGILSVGGGGGGWRFVGVRNRLLRRVWRPVLVAIPE
ncbi:hypothetical protein FCM35_KLT00493 [Carex littledalei]|uniref:Uncharacterized protein n=1 Tax=Carex littledalei TaxID=544730 RepID=A0A833R3D9_9POAL|nr:hypothetical protein FCM35_KLT00493 [Carex littledalei]